MTSSIKIPETVRNLLFFGSRTLDHSLVDSLIVSCITKYKPTHILTAKEPKGVCALTQTIAQRLSIPCLTFSVNREKYAKGMWEHRSKEALSACDYAIFIHDGTSKGTQNEIELAIKMQKPYEYHKVEQKNPTNPKNSQKQGEENGHDRRVKVSEYDEIFMQILRSQRLSLREIGRIAGFSPTTVDKYTKDIRFPKGTDLNLSIVLRQLAMKAALDAWKDKGVNGREYALTIEKYFNALKSIEDLRCVISLRDEILALENLMQEEDLPQDLLEVIQKRYDRLNEEIKG